MTEDVGRSSWGDAEGWEGDKIARINPTVLFFDVCSVLFVML